jgi:hypothetical protein
MPLSEPAVAILLDVQTWQQKRLATINEGREKKKLPSKEPSEWVFPSPRGNGPMIHIPEGDEACA